MLTNAELIVLTIMQLGLLFITGASVMADESFFNTDQPNWFEYNLELIAEPVLGESSGPNNFSASSWIQQISAGITLGTGLNKNRNDWSELDHWNVQVEFNQFTGNPSLNEQLGSVYPLQTLASPIGTWLTQASVERIEGEKQIDWSMKAGLISIEKDIMEIPVLNYYINSSLNTPYNVSIVGQPISPFIAPGTQIGAHHKQLGTLEYGYYYLNKTQQLASALGVNPEIPKLKGNLQILQWSLNPFQAFTDDTFKTKHSLPDPVIQVGSYLGASKLDISKSENLGDGVNSGIYGTITLPLALPIGQDNRIWMSGSLSLTEENNPLSNFMAGGILSQGIIPGRPMDVLALGFNRSRFSQSITPNKSYEGVVELNYTIQIFENLQIQPLIQRIINPSGAKSVQSIWAAGAQINLSL